jgi:hypothetical protein
MKMVHYCSHREGKISRAKKSTTEDTKFTEEKESRG